MMPNPITMQFAWDEDVLRCSRVLVSSLVLALALLIGGSFLMSRAHDASSVAHQSVALHTGTELSEEIVLGGPVTSEPQHAWFRSAQK